MSSCRGGSACGWAQAWPRACALLPQCALGWATWLALALCAGHSVSLDTSPGFSDAWLGDERLSPVGDCSLLLHFRRGEWTREDTLGYGAGAFWGTEWGCVNVSSGLASLPCMMMWSLGDSG